MKTIPGLMPGPVESDILQRRASQIGVDPKGKDPLVGPAKLARAGEHAAPIDPDREFERFAIFQREAFRGQLRASVEGEGRRRGKIFRDAVGAYSLGEAALLSSGSNLSSFATTGNIRQSPD